MAELLHYLDKMEYRPVPKPRGKVLLKRRPEAQEVTTNVEDDRLGLLLEIVDKRPVSGFKRVIVKEFERLIGVVQEKKSRKEGEPRRPDRDIYIENFRESIEELEVPVATQADADSEPHIEPISLDEFPKLAELEDKEPKTPEDKSRELDERLEEIEGEEPVTPEDKSRELDERMDELDQEEDAAKEREEANKATKRAKAKEGPPKQPRKKKGDAAAAAAKIPDVEIDDETEIEGAPVLQRVPKRPPLDKLVVKAPSYYMANRKLYIQNITKLFAKFSKELLDDKTPVSCDARGSSNDIELLIHQRIVREYLNVYTPYRGLLLYHGLGSGKTCTSIAIAEAAKTHKRIFVMTPASLKMNFFSELKKCGDSLYKKNQYWEFVSIEGRPEYVAVLSKVLSLKPEFIMKLGGAWLSDIRESEPNYSDLSPENQSSLDEQLNEMIRSKYVDINYNGLNKKKFDALVKEYGSRNTTKNPFDHSVVLVDEAHNLVSRIVNNLGKKDSISAKIYEYLQSATDVRIVFMSGTPIINYPHEMGVLFNMLRGYIKTWKITIPTTGVKLTSERILKMFHDGGLKTFDYIDYSNDTLSITRNPFGFVNVEKGTGKAAKPIAVPKTFVGGRSTPVKEHQDEDAKPANKNHSKKNHPKPSSHRKTQKKHSEDDIGFTDFEEGSKSEIFRRCDIGASNENESTTPIITTDADGEVAIATAPYTLNKGAIEIPKEREVDLSDEIKAQIELEVHQERNAVGEDHYHYGGAAVVDSDYSGIRLDEQGNLSDVDFERKVKEILTENGVKFLPKIELITYKSLPDTKNEFTATFVDMDTLEVERPDVLSKRILGLTSYFRSAQESLLPSFILSEVAGTYNPQYHIEYVEMSDHQFVDYAKERALEIEREPKKKTAPGEEANKEALKVSGSYRTFTRAKCNFSFPSEIPRPMPPAFNPDKDIAENDFDNINDDNGLDIGSDLEDNQSVQPISGEYEKAISNALAELKEAGSRYLSPAGLMQCSPKFAKILENLKNAENRGLHLVYSAFRTLEGIGVLKLVLEANGFTEFKLKKTGDTWSIVDVDTPDYARKPKFVLYTGTETAEEKEVIRNIYNSNWNFVPATITEKLTAIYKATVPGTPETESGNNYYGEIIKILMITSSGAEGINLENTRFVHVVEPYWHMVRVDQVVGRARRICSHKNLPEQFRTIKVFLYMSKFSDKQKFNRDNVGIMNRDTSRLKEAKRGAKTGETAITTDEVLYEIAVIKDRLTKQLLKAVKESSVDCSIYDNSKEGLVCYTYGHATSNEFGSFPNYIDDRHVREGTDVAKRKVAIKELEVQGKKYAHNTETNELYDLKSYKSKPPQVVILGHVEFVKDRPKFVPI